MLWVDKYRPQQLDKMEIHRETNERLSALAQSGDLPHVLMYGPSGAGKKTRVAGLLRQVYGASAARLKVEHKSYRVKTGRSSKTDLEVTAITSPHHIELTPADCGVRDRLVVQEVLKEIAQSVPIEGSLGVTRVPFKVVVLNEVDRLSRPAQAALRRTMERYTRSCRLILLSNSTTKVRIPSPTHEEVSTIVAMVAKKEGLSLPNDVKESIVEQGYAPLEDGERVSGRGSGGWGSGDAVGVGIVVEQRLGGQSQCERPWLSEHHSNRNLRRALLCLEATRVQQYPFQPGQTAIRMDWELYIIDVAKTILAEQSPNALVSVRERLYELLGHCIPPSVIMRVLTDELLKRVDTSMQHDIVEYAAFYEQRIQVGSKEIFHMEAFVAKVMSVYKRFLSSLVM